MEFRVAPERVFVVTPSMSWDAAKEKAWGQKASVFGALSNLVFRPAADDVQITKSELRYEPFWHIACQSELEFEVRETLSLPVKNAAAERVSLDLAPDTQLEVRDGSIQLTALTRCRESHRKDEVVDGMTGKPRPDLAHNLTRPMTELREIDSFAPADAVVWAPEFRSSFLVRQELGQLMTAVQADRIITDTVDVTSIALFFRPVYAFEYLWRSKRKTQSLEIDGVTLSPGPRARAWAPACRDVCRRSCCSTSARTRSTSSYRAVASHSRWAAPSSVVRSRSPRTRSTSVDAARPRVSRAHNPDRFRLT